MEKMEQIIMEMTEYVCDNLCAYPDDATCEQLNEICKDCKMSSFLKKLSKEQEKYSQIVLCKECEYYQKDTDYQGTEFAWCRNKDGLDGNLKEKDGCSRGRRKQ